MSYIIGIDIGTTHAKAVLTDIKGRVISQVKDSYPVMEPLPGYHEQSPETTFKTTWGVLLKIVQSVKDTTEIKCIAFSSAVHGIMAVDSKGQPLTQLLTWADTRSNDYANRLKNTERGKTIAQLTGTPVHPMSPLCKIAWMRDHLPDIFKSTNKFISGKEYIFFRLFGEYVIDQSMASATGLFNNQTLQWLPDALAFAGINEGHLSTPVSTFYTLPPLKEEYAHQLGLQGSVVFIAGASDGCLANLGSGAVLADELALTIGTSGAMRKLLSHLPAQPNPKLFNYLLDGRVFVNGGAINNGGAVIQWFISLFTNLDPYDDDAINGLIVKAADIPEGSDGLIFLPYIYGERAPVWDAEARGAFLGIRSSHTTAHFMRAVMEGICFSFLQIMELMQEDDSSIKFIYASGGFTASRVWLKMMTDILNKTICVSYSADASAMGAVYMAMYHLGIIHDWKEVKQFVRVDEEISPDKDGHDRYERNYKIFSGLYDKLKDDF
jgi:gluconokinase